jgi:hypothetical protein
MDTFSISIILNSEIQKITSPNKSYLTSRVSNIEKEKPNFKEKLPGTDFRQPPCRRVARNVMREVHDMSYFLPA